MNKYSFSEWIIENNISQKRTLWFLQTNIQAKIYQILDFNWGTSDIMNNNLLLNKILELNHPRSQALYDFVTSSNENLNWYLKNTENIKLVEDWIEILWDEFYLEDERVPDWEWISNHNWYTYFDFDSAQKHIESNWKKFQIDWNKYTDFLPWNNENKSNFFTKVLWLNFAGYCVWSNNYYYNQSTNIFYWSSSPYSTLAYTLQFNTSNILLPSNNNRAYRFSVRCIKK